MPDLHPRRQLRLDAGHRFAHVLDYVQRVGGGQHPDAHEGRGLAVETDVLIVVLRAQLHVGDFAQAHNHAVLLLHHHLAKFVGRSQIGVGDQVHRNHGALGAAERREVIVLRQRIVHLGGRNAARRHSVGLQPDAHGERAVAEDVRPLHAADRAQLRLHDARQVVGDLVLIEIGGREAEVHRRKLGVRGLQIDDRDLSLRAADRCGPAPPSPESASAPQSVS